MGEKGSIACVWVRSCTAVSRLGNPLVMNCGRRQHTAAISVCSVPHLWNFKTLNILDREEPQLGTQSVQPILPARASFYKSTPPSANRPTECCWPLLSTAAAAGRRPAGLPYHLDANSALARPIELNQHHRLLLQRSSGPAQQWQHNSGQFSRTQTHLLLAPLPLPDHAHNAARAPPPAQIPSLSSRTCHVPIASCPLVIGIVSLLPSTMDSRWEWAFSGSCAAL